MTFTAKSTILAALIIPGLAFAQATPGEHAGTAEPEIRAYLASQGYDVREIEVEDDIIEVDAVLNGTEFEIEIALATGEIVAIEVEEDDDDQDDDA